MITFRHDGNLINLERGDRWAAPADNATYRDTPAEELLAIVRDVRGGIPWRIAVAQRYEKSNPWLYQIVTSQARDLFFRQHPPPPGAKILDIGAGWGQISLPLARNARNEVTALEPTPERLAFIQAAATQERIADRLHFIQANFFDVEFEPQQFDLVCSIGVLEWVPKFSPGEPGEIQIRFLRQARALLSPRGRLVIGIENRLGLKYLLGALDDHLGAPDVAVYDAALAAHKWRDRSGQDLRSFTFTRAELAELLAAAGFRTVSFFAALPDYKLPQLILPLGQEINDYYEKGGFVPEHDGHSGQPLDFQAELQSHYNSLARLKIAHEFAPSFYVIASP
ncbi:MAG TPA: class I SAM-dependent methyltransferase [Opitutaceae bacterium]|jgi:2-polyprenyl-3-methyl-5-hydroxy-6-metoxy-1,4-benzoquinol methylase|nr:class I SAM-dependent methyltransferase [Opitutaceae bacterium]